MLAAHRRSPDGNWVVYPLTTVDSLKDKRGTDLWMVSWDATQTIQLTSDEESESTPKMESRRKIHFFSFFAPGNEKFSIMADGWTAAAAEGKKLTDFKAGVNDYAWSPDAKKILLTITDKEPEDTGKVKTTKPLVIDRYQYKRDIEGYRYKRLYTHLYVFDIATKKLDTLTRGNFDEGGASWSPDGTQVVFVSNRTADPDKNENSDIFVIDAKQGATTKQLTTWTGIDNSPRWSPDGKWIAYTRSTTKEDYLMC